MEKKLGKITSINLGLKDSRLGLLITLGGASWGVTDFKGTWDAETIKRTEHAQWTEEERSQAHDEIMRFISKLFKEAKVDSIDKLKNIPIEASFYGNTLSNWRILTEVI